MKREDIEGLRRQYSLEKLEIDTVSPSPVEQFRMWFHEAVEGDVLEANAMNLATVDERSRPGARIVLLKGFDDSGFIFFSNYQSRKGRELAKHPFACLTFFWKELERQVRIEGRINKISADESDRYFYSRPPGSQIGAMASPQSTVISSRQVIEEKLEKIEAEGKIIRPDHWGGYILKPDEFEFWQGRPNRLHDRIRYKLDSGNKWIIERLAP